MWLKIDCSCLDLGAGDSGTTTVAPDATTMTTSSATTTMTSAPATTDVLDDCWDVVKGKVVQEIQNWGKLYMVQFEITVSNSGEGWINVFHFTADSNKAKYGDRIPVLFIKKNTDNEAGYFYIGSDISGLCSVAKYYDYELEKKYQITIKQSKDSGNKYWYEIIINAQSIFMIENTAPVSFPNVKLYGSDPWYNSFSSDHGSVCNFTIGKIFDIIKY